MVLGNIPAILDLLKLIFGTIICYLRGGGLVPRLASEDVWVVHSFLRQLSERGCSQRMTHKMERRRKFMENFSQVNPFGLKEEFKADIQDLRKEGRKNSEPWLRKGPRDTYVIKIFQPPDDGVSELEQERLALDRERMNLEKERKDLEKEEMAYEDVRRTYEKEKASLEIDKKFLKKDRRTFRKHAKAFLKKMENGIKEKEKFVKKRDDQLKKDQEKLKKRPESPNGDREFPRDAERLLAEGAVPSDERTEIVRHQALLDLLSEGFASREEAVQKCKEDFAKDVKEYLRDKEEFNLQSGAFIQMRGPQILERAVLDRVNFSLDDCRRKMEQIAKAKYPLELKEKTLKTECERLREQLETNKQAKKQLEIRVQVFALNKAKLDEESRDLELEWERFNKDRDAFTKKMEVWNNRHRKMDEYLRMLEKLFLMEKQKFKMEK
ncbi:golgin subfamily A member 6-like protein 22 [Macrobrachium rosenbergii]|uniref:golgin subfamily A member 6-like protein 22 n=1 Tax=Macrobrachium rosenbergii TaxID=79674 RepID=UPI0034D516F2